MKLREWNARLHGLVIFRALLDDPVVAKLLDLTDRMEAGTRSMGPVCDAVASFEAALFEQTTNLGEYLSNAVLETETVCVRQAAAGGIAPVLQSALDSELHFLQELCGLTLDELFQTAYSEQSQRPELAFLRPADAGSREEGLWYVRQAPCLHGGGWPVGAGEVSRPPAPLRAAGL